MAMAGFLKGLYEDVSYGIWCLQQPSLNSDYLSDPANDSLAVFIHGLKGSVRCWTEHVKIFTDLKWDVFVPSVPKGGNCSLQECSEPIVWRLDGIQQLKTYKKVVLFGASNGTRILHRLYHDVNWRSGIDLRMISIAGFYNGISWIRHVKRQLAWTRTIDASFIDDVTSNSPLDRELVPDRTLYIATLTDTRLIDVSSAIPSNAVHRLVVEGPGHCNIHSATLPDQMNFVFWPLEKEDESGHAPFQSLAGMQSMDQVIIGAGPAGLACASKSRFEHTMLIETGARLEERNRDHLLDAVHGVGGAGLFSDGKFSFYPSATNLYKLSVEPLSVALHTLLVDCPQLAEYCIPGKPTEVADGDTVMKPYPSIYLTLQERIDLTAKLWHSAKATNTRCGVRDVWSIPSQDQTHAEYVVCVKREKDLQFVRTPRIVFATGRFGPVQLKELSLRIPTIQRRVEVGFRVEMDNNLATKLETQFPDVLQNMLDPKFRVSVREDLEARTFCWCRDGEVVATAFHYTLPNDDTSSLMTFSGRADVKLDSDGRSHRKLRPTGKTNFGLNVRFTNTSAKVASELIASISAKPFCFDASANQFCDPNGEFASILKRTFGALAVDIHQASSALINKLGLLQLLRQTNGQVRLHGPTLEGVGSYPDIDENTLQINGLPGAYVVGDCTGIFRGIIAALVSGYFVACSMEE